MSSPLDDRFRALADAALEAIVVHAEGRILDFNRAAEEMFRICAAAARGSNLMDFVVPEERESVLKRIRSGSEEPYDSIGLRLDGTRFPVEARGRSVVWDGRPARVAVMRDITDRRAAEAAIRESEELNRRIIETMPGGCVRVGADGAVLAANEEARRFLGLAWDALARRHVHDWKAETISEDGAPCLVEQYPVARCLKSGQLEGPTTIGVRRPDGLISWGVFRATPIMDPVTRACQGAVVTFLDITERKREEESLRETQRLESLGLMAGGIAHDFNNLLAVILGHESLALARLEKGSEAREHIEKSVTATRRAADLTRQILTYTGRAPFVVGPVDLNAFVEEIRGLLQVAIPKNIHLRTLLEKGLPSVAADRSQLQQILLNLALNAVEATPTGGGEVRLRTALRRIGAGEGNLWPHPGYEPPPGDYVELTVADDGCGMTAAVKARIFEPFFTKKQLGRGLGLSAVLGILRAHRGGLRVESVPERGTVFSVLLPASREAPRATVAHAKQSGEVPAGTPGPVLIIDDEPAVREVVGMILKDVGIASVAAGSGEEGIAAFRDRPGHFPLVILDLSMPGVGGEETFRQLRRIDPWARVLLASGYHREEAMRRFSGHGLAGFLAKPFEESELLSLVRRELSRDPT